MNQQEIKDFANVRGYALMLGTRNNELQPIAERAFGFKVSEDGTMVSAFIPKANAEKTIENLNGNGRAALIVSNVFNLSTWQFKGSYLSHADCIESDMQILQENMMEFGKFIEMHFGEKQLQILQGHNIFPLTSVTFKIEDIFNQTPGPNAGQKIN